MIELLSLNKKKNETPNLTNHLDSVQLIKTNYRLSLLDKVI